MGVTSVAVVSAAASIKAQRDQRKAERDAAQRIERANIESVEQLAEAGRLAEADIIRANKDAAISAGLAAMEAERALTPFADSEAFNRAQEEILSGLPVDDAFAQSIRQASTDFVRSRPEFDTSGKVGTELERQASITASGLSPEMTQDRLGAGQQGIAALTDIAQARQRGFQRLGDIAGSQATQRAGVIMGQTPQLAQLTTGAREARLLGDVAGQKFRTGVAESLAGLGGQLFGLRSRRGARDEFGFAPGEDPFS